MALDISQYKNWNDLIAALSPTYGLRNGDSGLTDGSFSAMPGAQVIFKNYGDGDTGPGFGMDQPWNWKPGGADVNALNMSNPDKAGWNSMYSRGTDGSIQRRDYEQSNGVDPALLKMIAAAATMGYALPAMGSAMAGGASAIPAAATEGGFAALPAGGMTATGTLSAAPWAATAAEGLGSGLVGTGVSDIGALMGTTSGAFELGSGLAGVSSADLATSLMNGIPVDGVDQLANEAEKLTRQQAIADAGGDLLPTNLPTVDLSSTPIQDVLKKIATPENISKLAKVLTGGAGGSPAGGSLASGMGGFGSGFGGVPNELSNMTPGMANIPAVAQALHSGGTTQPFQITDAAQPKFNFSDYVDMPTGVATRPVDDSGSKLAQIARLLQG